ncbi:hypothetical protein [Qipengyuania spongiae]|uniref:Uncharacterized protein n=1 Tax=Qipengyuania spongiae TaxID=2909673 RepID=A0ABY5T2P7_9SPHN|nr:hypothetical protein [Qipengyuania spongiae]UVI39244.1 hypothetical protein L1F33_13590 [Qipengyuania spongiae]
MNEELAEAAEVRARTERLIDTLGGAGMTQRAIVVGMQLALTERLLVADGADAAVKFLRDQAEQVEQWGPEYLKALRP